MVGDSHIGSGGLGRVYRGLGPDGEVLAIKMVSVKNRDRLEKEWRMYLELSKSGLEGSLVPRCFGLYEHPDFVTLVTEFAGVKLADENILQQDEKYVLHFISPLAMLCLIVILESKS
jgi:hypothetical protein